MIGSISPAFDKKITFDRFLSKFLIEENNSKKELFIKSNNQKIEIGSFLNQEENPMLSANSTRKKRRLMLGDMKRKVFQGLFYGQHCQQCTAGNQDFEEIVQ